MRIVCTMNNPQEAQILSAFLSNEGIENQLEISKNTHWDSPHYGDATCNIWIIDEDCVETANKWVDLFKQDPNNPLFHPPARPKISEDRSKEPSKGVKRARPTTKSLKEPLGTITLYLIVLCCFLFLATEVTEPSINSIPSSLPSTPIFSSPIKKKLLYDFPYAYEIVDKLVNLYGVERLNEPQELPQEGQLLIEKFHHTPYWQGYYDVFLNRLQGNPPPPDAPMFEKLKQGEYWRLISPAFLHSDILHILFNMIWLIVLGKQLEQRLGMGRYLLFILLTGVFSNTAQYLMGGSNFIGFSGIICAMLTFVWARQRISAWEGYQLEKSTMVFMAFFILSMFSLQLISFYFEANHQSPISPGIANTAHLSGAAIGYFLGRLSFFKWKI